MKIFRSLGPNQFYFSFRKNNAIVFGTRLINFYSAVNASRLCDINLKEVQIKSIRRKFS